MDLLEKFSNADAIAANEFEIRQELIKELKKYADEIFFDNLGSTIIRVGNRGPKLMLCAHMDEVGFIIKNIADSGKIYLKEIGNISKQICKNVRCRITTNKKEKILAVLEIDENDELFIDIGVNSKQKVLEKGIEIGNMVCFDTEFKKLTEDVVCGKAFDDRVGCYALSKIIQKIYKKELNCTVYFVFSSSEEVGTRGAKTASHLVKPDFAFVVDVVSPKNGFDYSYRNTRQNGEGFLLEVYDKTFIPNQYMINLVKNACKKLNIKFQLDTMNGGGTDAAEIHKNLDGVQSIVTAISIKYCHSPYSLVNFNDINDLVKVYEDIILNFDASFKIDWEKQ